MKKNVRLIPIWLIGAAVAALLFSIPLLLMGKNSPPSASIPGLATPAYPAPLLQATVVDHQKMAYPPSSQITPTVTALNYPTCEFKSDIPADQSTGSNLDQFTFSEPKVVLTSESNIGILNWTSNSQEILIARYLLDDGFMSIELLNPQNGSTVTLGNGFDFFGLNAAGNAVWIDSLQAVAYAQLSRKDKPVLRISNGKDLNLLAPNKMFSSNIALDTDNSILFFANDNTASLQRFDLNDKQAIPVTGKLSLPSQMNDVNDYWGKYQISSRPGERQWIFYNDGGAYLVDRKNNTICEIPFGNYQRSKLWALQILWSPDGRFLTAFTTIGNPVVPFIDLMVIDTLTGNKWTVNTGSPKNFKAMSWAPNSRNFVILANSTNQGQGESMEQQLYLVDVAARRIKQILTDYPIIDGTAYSGISWSPDGNSIAMNCKRTQPETFNIESQLCVIIVEGGK